MTTIGLTREQLERLMRDHWLAGIHCDHATKTDKPSCSCSMWNCQPQPSVGEAVERWIEHFMAKVVDLVGVSITPEMMTTWSGVDKSDEADLRRFRWLIAGDSYFLEEECIAGHKDCDSPQEQDEARTAIDKKMRGDW